MHLDGSRTILNDEASFSVIVLLFSNRIVLMPNCAARSCSVQFPLFWQIVQSRQWFASSS
jgi:hypothetical protein